MNINRKSDRLVQVVNEEIIHAPIQEVFPLCCPVMEYKWIAGWKCELLHCPKGHVEKGTVFNEIWSAPILDGSPFGKVKWTAVLHEPDEYRVHYRLDNSASSSLFKMEMEAMEPAMTRFRFDFSYEALNGKGKRVIEDRGAAKIGFMLIMLAAMLKHYLERGKMLKSMEIKKMALRYEYFSMKDKFRMLLNDFAMKAMKDEDRKRYFAGMPISKNAFRKQ